MLLVPLFVFPLLSACEKPTVSVNLHGVNYTADTFSYAVADPANPDSGGGELIDPFASGGTTCCVTLPKIWRPGIKLQVHTTHWVEKRAENSIKEFKGESIVEVPSYVDGKPGELWVLREADGKVSVISSDFQPDHPNWPGKAKGWPVPSLEYRRERWELYRKDRQLSVDTYRSLLDKLEKSPSARAKEAWAHAMEYERESLVGYEGPEDPRYPGGHSDVGCGYCPTEQGKGTDPNGGDMLLRIPLLLMYKAARLNGVPLKLELANVTARLRFALKKEVIAAFNAYIGTCSQKQGPIHHIMREQARKQIEWRVYRRVSGKNAIQDSTSFRRASTFDKNDLFSAHQEFEDEIAKFLSWRKNKGSGFLPASQKAGFGNEHQAEWEEIATWWDKMSSLSPTVIDFFDNYIHDSRAWFKLFPGNPDAGKKAHAQLVGWVGLRQLGRDKVPLPRLTGKADYGTVSDRLSPAQRLAADEYARTKQIPRMITEGREPWESSFGWLAGAEYLRFRKIYGGTDAYLLSSLDPAADRTLLSEQDGDGNQMTALT